MVRFSTRQVGRVILVPALLVAAGLARTVPASEPQQPRNLDARAGPGHPSAAPRAGQLQAVERLREAIPSVAATYDLRTGATRTLLNREGYLTPPRPNLDARTIALEFVTANHALLGLAAQDLAEYQVTDEVQSAVTGATHVYLRQVHLGLPVYNGQLHVNVNREGRIMSVNNAFMPELAASVSQGVAELSAGDAVRAVAGHLGIVPARPPRVISVSPSGVTTLRHEEVSRKQIAARLMWLPIRSREAHLVWNLQVATLDDRHVYDFTVDAVTGKIWTRFDWVAEDSYRVYPEPFESPNHSPTPPPADGRQIVLDPADPVASPFGWHDTDGVSGAEFTIPRGNNVHAYDDNDDTAGGICTSTPGPPAVEPDCGGLLECDFNFPIDLGVEDPRNYIDAAVTNLFYWNNYIHDVQFRYGFDEAGGNFQQNNYGKGGIQADYVLAEAQDGSGTNNANFCTPPDGQRPRMQMFMWSGSPRLDGDFDNGIIVHEYGHGISNRLVGGPSNVSCLGNSQQPGEGLSDWWLLAYTAQAHHLSTDPRGVGTYAKGQPIDGPGVRTQRYSTDPAINTHTYGSINGKAVPHGVGEVWAQVAWEMYWALVDQHGFGPDLANAAGGSGNQRAMLYVNEGLKNTICSPTFVDVRDGILQAAADNFAGADVCPIWEVFAAFGIGEDAVSGGPDSLSPTEGFDVPAMCPGVPNVSIRTTVPTANEAGPAGQFTITRTRDRAPALTVLYTVSGTATPDSDYVALSGSVALAALQETATISVDALNDPEIERDETVVVTLTADPGYNIIGAGVDTVNVVSDEQPPVVSISATAPSATEAGPAGEFTVSRQGAVLEAMDVFYSVEGTATPGIDYVALSGVVSFAAGQASAAIPVDALDDPEVERPETVTVTLLPDPAYDVTTGFGSTDTVDVVSDESPPVVSAKTTILQAFEAGLINAEFTFTRSGDVSRPGPVFYEVAGGATPDVDYVSLPGVVNFAAGQVTARLPVVPIDDTFIERDETVFIRIQPNPDYDKSGIDPHILVKSDEPIPEVRITASDPFASEPDLTSGAFTITRTGYLGDVTTVDYAVTGTATPGSDYTPLSGSVAMGIGVRTVNMFVDPLPDGETEANETVTASIKFRTLYTIVPPDNATVTILSGDQQCNANADCDDGQFCNGVENCTGGVCQPGTAPACDDGIACTVDVCNELSDACDTAPEDAGCDNGLFCDGVEVCVDGIGCQPGSDPCDDGIACTADGCDEASDICSSLPDDALCDDGLFCDGVEICDVALGCQPGSDACAPGEFCNETTDFCDPDPQCLIDTDCTDASACTIDTCVGGVCVNECSRNVSGYPYGEDFEAGFGDWSNVAGDHFDWTRGSGETNTSNTGPPGDHTTGSGFYLFIDALNRNAGDSAILEGPCFDLANASAASMSFWYHMFGRDMGTLDVEVSTDCITWTNVWSLSGDQGDSWHRADVDLGAHAGGSIRVRFIATRGPDRQSDIAIDDVSVDVISQIDVRWPGKSDLAWNAAGAVTRYNVYRGTLEQLVDGNLDGVPDAGYGTCQNARDPDLTDTGFAEPDVPTPQQIGFHFLVSYTTGSGEGGLGSASSGTPRTVVPCP